jgi:hypothetical protein
VIPLALFFDTSFTKPTKSLLAKILHKDSPLKKLSIFMDMVTFNDAGGTMVPAIIKA